MQSVGCKLIKFVKKSARLFCYSAINKSTFKEVKGKKSCSTDQFLVKLSSFSTRERIGGILKRNVFSRAKYPLLDFGDLETRAMVAISLGCDVIPGCGVKGVGASKI